MAKRKRELEAVVGPPSTARCNDTRPELGSRKQKGRPKAGGIDHDDGGSRVQVVWELADGSRRWKKRVSESMAGLEYPLASDGPSSSEVGHITHC